MKQLVLTAKGELFEQPSVRCPLCGQLAITKLPPSLLAKQPDNTTHVCHPAWGGCNNGFSRDKR